MRAQAVGKQDMIEAEWNRSYTGKYLPGDTIHEIRNGPLKSSITNGAAARVLLARNVKRSANMLDRSQRLQRSEEQLAMKLKAKCTYKTSKGYSSERNGVRGGAASTRAALLSSAAAESDVAVVGSAVCAEVDAYGDVVNGNSSSSGSSNSIRSGDGGNNGTVEKGSDSAHNQATGGLLNTAMTFFGLN